MRGVSEERERRALRLIAVTFFLLAAYVLAEAVRHLLVRAEPEQSVLGIAITAAALVVMPLLAWGKRRIGQQIGSATLLADATESAYCALLAAAALTGLLLNAAVGWWWADPVASLRKKVGKCGKGTQPRLTLAMQLDSLVGRPPDLREWASRGEFRVVRPEKCAHFLRTGPLMWVPDDM